MESVVANELNYKTYDYSHSSYQLTQIFQQIGLPTVTLGTSGGPDTIFQIPANAINLSKSILNFSLSPPAVPALGAAAVNSPFSTNWIFSDGLCPIRQIQLYDENGLYYADIYDVGNYTNMTFRYSTKAQDLLCADQAVGAYYYSGSNEGIQISGLPAGAVAAGNLARPTGWTQTNTAAWTGGAAGNNVTVNRGFTNYYEPSYLLPGAGDTTVAAGVIATSDQTPVITFKIPLRRIKDTIFGIDKTLYFGGKILYLRIVWQSTSKIGYIQQGSVPNLSKFNPAYGATITPTAFTGNVNIFNLYFYLAKEMNIVVENSLKEKCRSAEGFHLYVPWVSQFKQNVPASSINNITMRFNNALGRKLLKVLWTPYNAQENLSYSYDHNVYPTDANAAAVGTAGGPTIQKINNFYTLVNNTRTSQYNYSCNNQPFYTGSDGATIYRNVATAFNDPYDVIMNKIKGSSIFSRNEFYYNFVWYEDFTDNTPLMNKPLYPDEQNYVDGLDLTNGEVKYDIFVTQGGTANIAVNFYAYAVTLKELVINSSGVSLS